MIQFEKIDGLIYNNEIEKRIKVLLNLRWRINRKCGWYMFYYV